MRTLADREFEWCVPARFSEEERRLARLAVAQRVLDGKLPRAELWELLGMLGLR